MSGRTRALYRLTHLARQIPSATTATATVTIGVKRAMSSYPSTVKAVGIQEVGGVDKIEDLELPFPSPKPNELLVKARADFPFSGCGGPCDSYDAYRCNGLV